MPLERVGAAGQRRGQVEPEAVDVHLLHPVAQRVGDHRQGARVAQVQRVAAAGDVDVATPAEQPVVRRVVQAAPGQGRPVGAALGGVVVDDVEQRPRARRRAARAPCRGTRRPAARASRPPSSRRAARRSRASCSPSSSSRPRRSSIGSLVNWCTGSSSTVVTPRPTRCSTAAGCASPAYVPRSSSGTPGCAAVKPLHVQLVDDRVGPRHLRRPVALPVVRRVDDDRVRHERRPSRARRPPSRRRPGRGRAPTGRGGAAPSSARA